MRVLHVVISRTGFRQVARNPERLVLLDILILLAVRLRARLLVIPAGFLAARNEQEMRGLVVEIGRRALAAGIAVIGGVDAAWVMTKRARTLDDAVRAGRLPFFGFAVGAVALDRDSADPWRQVSIDNQNAEHVAEENIPGPGRVVLIDGFSVAVLVCGELFNRRARAAIGALRPRLVVDTGHKSMGQGLIPAMRSVARTAGCPVAHAHHLAGYETQQIHFVNVQGGRESVPANAHLERSGGLWASWALREL